MQLVADDLLCPSCDGYVHLFLERCPACGDRRAGQFAEALARGPLGAGALLEDEATQRAARQVVLRYSMRSIMVQSAADLRAAFGVIAGSMPYRASITAAGPSPALPAGPTTLDGASLVLVGPTIEVRAGPSGRAAAAIPLDGILAATPITKGVPGPESWVGITLADRQLLPERPLSDGDLLVTFAIGGAAGQLALANRRGLFAPSARPDHYATLAHWIGILGAAAAEARWLTVGPAAYAADLGLGDPVGEPAASSDGATPAATPGVEGAAAGRPPTPVLGVRAALEELETLRSAGLVSAGEYETKRREILARL